MFLKLTQLPKGERLLRIPDYVDKLVFHADEWTISEVGLSKPLVSYGPKSLNSTFNIAMGDANICDDDNGWCKHLNLSHFIAVTVGKLPSTQDVQLHYFNLAYAIKIMELNNKFTWASMLRYDDKLCSLQAIYNCPWTCFGLGRICRRSAIKWIWNFV